MDENIFYPELTLETDDIIMELSQADESLDFIKYYDD